MVSKKKSKKKPRRPIRHKKPMKTIKKERYNKKSKQIRKKKSSRGVKKRTKKVNMMRGGLFVFSTSKTASTYTYGIKFLILPDKDTLDSEFIEAIKDLIGIVLYIPIETFGNKTYYTLYKGFKIYYTNYMNKSNELEIHIINENKLDITINIMINITQLRIMSINYNDEIIYNDHNITLYGNINAGNSIYYKKDEIKYTNKQILNEISKGTLKTFGEIIIEDNFSDITKYYSNPNLHSILNYFLKDYMIFKGIKLPYYITNPYDFKYDLEKLLNLLFYYDSTKKNIDFTEQNTIEILYKFIKYKYSIKPNSYQNNIEIIVSIFKGLVTVEDLNTKFCILHALIKSFVNNPLKIEKITRDIIETITSTVIEKITSTVIEKINEEQKAEEQIAEEQKTEEQKAKEQKAKYTKCKDTIFEAIKDILITINKELQEIKKAEEKANEEQKRKEQLEKEKYFIEQNKAHQKLHSLKININDLKNIRRKLIKNTFAIAFNNNNNKYIIYYGSELKVELIERKVKKGWKKATEILEELNTFLRENTHPIHPIYYIKLDSNTNTIVNFDYNATIIWWDVTYPEIEWIHPVNSKTNILNGNDNGTFFVKEYCHQNSKNSIKT